MKKRYLIMAAIASLALVSCSDEEFVGNPELGPGQGKTAEIVFGSVGKGMTRADLTGADAANELNKNFVFEGTKAVSGTTYSPVINDYQANYVTNTAHSTESNSDNWEYVGYKNVPGGVTTNVGVVAFAANTTDNANAIDQSIKYWDYATSQYDFAAYSLGKGVTANNTTTYAKASAIDLKKAGSTTASDFVYSLTGSVDELKACYISDLVTHYNKQASGNYPAANDFGKVVTFNFRSLATKIRLAFYETIPGYSVKDINFYSVAKDNNNQVSGEPTNIPTLFSSSAVLPSGNGTMKITFPNVGWDKSPNGATATKSTDYNKAHVAFELETGSTAASTLTFDAINNFATSAEGQIAANTSPFIGRASNDASYAGGLVDADNDANTPATGKYYTILPSGSGNNLQLRIKYTLVSTDNSAETIEVDNATAVIPAELAQWQPNYAYTYIFKISDMTNGSTGVDGSGNVVTGLTPITLNAVVVDSEDGIQETITTVSTPSITTYTQGKVVTENDEYISNNTIYVIVNNGTSNVTLTTTGDDINAKLYTVTVDNGALQTISEESVDNAIRYGTYDQDNKKYTVQDAKEKTLVVTEANGLTASTKIEAADSPTGNEITVNGAKFTAGAAGTIYAFQYRKAASDADTKYKAAEANTYNAGLPGAIKTSDTPTYKFDSYGSATENTPKYGEGKVKQVSQANGWTTVLVITNTADNENVHFVGKQFKVQATTLTANTRYELYTDAGAPTGIYVTVTTDDSTLTEDEVNAYNATLPGAVKEGTIKPDAYGYKIIKIKE